MSAKACYVPILKAKQSELMAVRNLGASVKPTVIPLFELQPRETDKLLTRTLNQIERAWEAGLPLFLDVDKKHLRYDEAHAIENLVHIFNHALPIGYRFIPVTGVNRTLAFQRAIRPFVIRRRNGLCVRLRSEDWSSMPDLNRKLNDLINQFEVGRSEVDLVIDFSSFLPSQSSVMATSALTVINSISNIKNFRTLVFSATAFPSNPSFSSGGVNYLPRSEWNAWLNLRDEQTLRRKPLFGDYTIVHPDFPDDINYKFVKIAPKIKYTADSQWLYIRGEAGDWPGFQNVCSILIQQPEYRGPSFSWGDEYIQQCANNVANTGSPGNWVTIGINHHITLASILCSSLP
jgi:hypothetical protein